jgi:hypothetical protein
MVLLTIALLHAHMLLFLSCIFSRSVSDMLPPALRRPFIPPWLDVVVVGIPRSKQIFIPRCFFAFVAGSEMALLFWHLKITKWLDGRIRPSLANILFQSAWPG